MSMTKTSTLFIAVAALLCGTVAADAAPARAKSFIKKKTVQVDRKHVRALAEQANVKYLPLKETVSTFDEDAEEWVAASEVEYTYDAYGRVATSVERDLEEGGMTRLTYTYDEEGRVTGQVTQVSSDEGATWVNSEYRKKTYDTVVPDFVTESIIYYWTGSDWAVSYGNLYPVVRTSTGLVASVARQAPMGDGYEDIAKVTNTASADGKTISRSVITEMNHAGGWDELVDLRDIVWHNTDGQVMAFDLEDYAIGANRVTSASSYYEGELEATLIGTYTNDFEGTLRFDFLDDSWLEIANEWTDEATKSYITSKEVSYFDYPEEEEDINGDGVIDDNDMILYIEKEIYSATNDEHGNLVKEESAFYLNDEPEFVGGIINEYEYNADGAMTQMTAYSYEFDEEERYPDVRVDVTAFHTFAGVENVVADGKTTVSVTGRTLTVSGAAASTLTVVALDGKTVATAAGEGSYSVALDGLAAGVYVATVSTGAETVTTKIALR